jgi:hypothetical protein
VLNGNLVMGSTRFAQTTYPDQMELQEAIAKANQVLDDERASPTLSYLPSPRGFSGPVEMTVGALQLQQIRSQRPRQVAENPRLWEFKSTNYTLLCALVAQIAKDSKPQFIDGVLLRMVLDPACASARYGGWGVWNGFASELPLVAEFCVRNGASKRFFSALGEASLLPGHAILLQHLEDMIALNFTVFSDAEYQILDLCVASFRRSADRQLHPDGKRPSLTSQWPGLRNVRLWALGQEIQHAADCLQKECRKARYIYLKGSLLEGLNIEVNQDKDAVQGYLRSLGFTEGLAQSLDEAERLYYHGGDAFSLKASMGHLRSFLENLHKDAFPVLQERFGGVLPENWGAGLRYLRENRVLSGSEEKFAASLYTMISDQAVHPLVAERECARLIRNVVIEYALLFLRKLEKLGLKRS